MGVLLYIHQYNDNAEKIFTKDGEKKTTSECHDKDEVYTIIIQGFRVKIKKCCWNTAGSWSVV